MGGPTTHYHDGGGAFFQKRCPRQSCDFRFSYCTPVDETVCKSRAEMPNYNSEWSWWLGREFKEPLNRFEMDVERNKSRQMMACKIQRYLRWTSKVRDSDDTSLLSCSITRISKQFITLTSSRHECIPSLLLLHASIVCPGRSRLASLSAIFR